MYTSMHGILHIFTHNVYLFVFNLFIYVYICTNKNAYIEYLMISEL